ncbi:MAG: ATP synthase F0 subunit C [Gemmataceae bacterium]|nr:ATP synthase F0 subunit C [Gemmataceae bacterium]
MKLTQLALLTVAVLLVLATPALAQAPSSATLAGAGVGAGLGAALTIIGAGYGFGKIGSAALESMARQPEVAGRIQTAMLIIAALLEGATFFSLIVCILVNGNATF